MKFLIAILCLVSMTVFGAVPSYEKFVGAGGIVVTLNPPNGNVTIDGSGIAGPTNGVSASFTTNVAQYFSTNPISGWQWGSSRLTNLAAFYTNVMLLNTSSNLVFAISNAPNNTLIRLAPGTYPLVATVPMSNGLAAINMFGKTNIAIEGAGMWLTILDAGSSLGALMQLTNANKITFRDIQFKGYMLTNYTLYHADYGWGAFEYFQVQNMLIERCAFPDHFDHGVFDARGGAGGSPTGPVSTNNIVVKDCYFDNIGSWRATVGGVDHPSLTTGDGTALPGGGMWSLNNYFVNCRRAHEPFVDNSAAVIINSYIIGSVIRNCTEHAITLAGQTNIHQVLIENVKISWDQGYNRRGTNPHPGSCGIVLNGGQRHTVRAATILNAPDTGIRLMGSTDQFGITIEDCIIRGQYADTANGAGGGIDVTSEGVGVYNFRELTIRNNLIEGKRYWGIRLESVRDSSLQGNKLINCGTNGSYYAMSFAASGGNLCSNVLASGNIVLNNGLAPPTEQGLLIQSGVKAITLIGNQISGVTTPIDNSGGTEVKFVQQRDAQGNIRNDLTNNFAALRLWQQGTNKFLWLDASSNVVAGTIGSGLTLTAGTLAATGGGGGGAFNPAQFSATGVTNLIAGAAQTNANFWGLGTNQGDFYAVGSFRASAGVVANSFANPSFAGGFALFSDVVGVITEAVTTSAELDFLSGVTSAIQPQFSNSVRVAPGPNITITTNGAGGIMTYTVNGSAGGSGFAALEVQTNGTRVGLGTNINFTTGITGSFSGQTFTLGSISSGGATTNAALTNLINTVGRNVTNVVSLSTLNTTSYPITNNYANGVLTLYGLEEGSNITINTNGSNLVISATGGGGGNFSTNSDGSANFTGTGVGAWRLYDNAQTEYFQMEAPFNIQTNVVIRGQSNGAYGLLATRSISAVAATPTNQLIAIGEGVGMLTNNNGVYGWMTIPAGGGTGNVSSNANGGLYLVGPTTNMNTFYNDGDIYMTGGGGVNSAIFGLNNQLSFYTTNSNHNGYLSLNFVPFFKDFSPGSPDIALGEQMPFQSLRVSNFVDVVSGYVAATNVFIGGITAPIAGGYGLAVIGGIIASNTVNANSLQYSNGQLLISQTNYSGMSNTLSLILSNSFTAPSNTVQDVGIAFDTSMFTTGGAAGTNWRPRGEFKLIPAISAAPATTTWVLQTRTNATGPAFTNMTVTSLGNITVPGGFITLGTGPLYLSMETSGVLQLGLDASSPVAQTAHGADGTGTSIAGGSMTIGGGKATGTGTPGRVLIQVGTNSTASSATVQGFGTAVTAGGVLKVNTTTTGNVGAGEDDLITYSVPQAQMSVNGDFIEFVVWGTTAANGNTKQLKVYFGATAVIDGTAVALNGLSWKAHGRIVRTGAATQTATCELTVGGTLLSTVNGTICLTTAPAETLAAPITFKVTGAATSDNDIVQNGMTVKWYPGQ